MLAGDIALMGPVAPDYVKGDTVVLAADLADETSFERFSSIEQFTDFVLEAARDRYYTTTANDFGLPFVHLGQIGNADFSDSNLVETDGRHVFALNDNYLSIVDALDATDLKLISRLQLTNTPTKLHRYGDRLVVLSAEPYGESSHVSVIDVSDVAAPSLLYDVTVDGTVSESWLVNSELRLAIQDTSWLPRPAYSDQTITLPGVSTPSEPESEYLDRVRELVPDMLPAFEVSMGGEIVEEGRLVEVTDVFKPTTDDVASLLTVVRLDLAAATPSFDAASIPANGGAYFHANDVNLYAATTGNETNIHHFQFEPTIELAGSTSVAGRIANQFSMDEHQGHLRVVTSARRFPSTPGATTGAWIPPYSNLYVLDASSPELTLVGSIPQVAMDESFNAVRFVGDAAYLGTSVAFENNSNLRTIDLSDPTSPRLDGKLGTTANSQFLMPIGNNLVLDFGQNTVSSGSHSEVSLYDVSDSANPTKIDRFLFTDRSIEFGRLAHFGNSPGESLLSVFVRPSVYNFISWPTFETSNDSETFLINIDREGGLTLQSKVVHHSPGLGSVSVGDALLSASGSNIVSVGDGGELDRLFYISTATPDAYSFSTDQNWHLDVLANDIIAENATSLRISSVDRHDGLDVSISADGQSLLAGIQDGYSSCPQAAALDGPSAKLTLACWTNDGSPRTYRITYTITDDNGNESQSDATIKFEPKVVANNDSVSVFVGETTSFSVLENDRIEIPATVSDVDTSETRGTVVNITNSTIPRFQYTAPLDFEGEDSFRYTLTSDDGTTSDWATVYIRVSGVSVRDRTVDYSLEVTDANGKPVSEVTVGQEFSISLYVQETTPVQSKGVFSAYADMRFDPELITVTGEITFGEHYQNVRNGNIDVVDGWVDEVGGISGINSIGSDRVLVATIPFVATSPGTMRLRTNPADDYVNRPTLLYGSDTPPRTDQLKYKGAWLDVVAASSPFDLNGDGEVSPLDALMAINELNVRAENGGQPVPPAANERFDVNSDGAFSPLDALAIINQLPTTTVVSKEPISLPALPAPEFASSNRIRKSSTHVRRDSARDTIFASNQLAGELDLFDQFRIA